MERQYSWEYAGRLLEEVYASVIGAESGLERRDRVTT
jgi:hypothetical protein